ncbi:MAG: Uma2 family endonuclease [Candidatus Loosdrechtia sp.]|uniref:Uma2 family endonuclease n=1 Tax=Candidatus Loosdrechtia sp. TaxID=3101272 RepID=UPI003A60FBBF|nr:MAG: Uma2 family endonuclease [Candidatus Jettenia sp. AMX2]
MNTTETIHRFSIKEYHQLIESNILHEDDRVELIEGRIVDMVPVGSKHAASVGRLNRIFTLQLQTSVIVQVQNPVQLLNQSELQPDIVLLKNRDDFYAERLPTADDILLVIEVADSSLEYDRETKIPLYAKAHIPEVWLVNLRENIIDIYSDPSSEGYHVITKCRGSQTVTPQNFPDIKIVVSDIFGQSS